MRHTAVMLLAGFLSFASMGCEREDLHYDNPAEWDGDIDEDPYVPEGNDSLHQTAELLTGEWKGSMVTDYVDSHTNQPVTKSYDDVVMVFQPFAERAVNGKGKETISEDGKVVWWMPFTWYVDAKDAIVIKDVEGTKRTATQYELTESQFNATFVSSDLLETSVYSLKRNNVP
ncbi:MAG: hypothetical protein J5529_08245 [Prevotella sp.]|nr:hypothetical protein [Prevotella sp.]